VDTAPKRSDLTRPRAQQATVTAGAAVLLFVVLVSHAIAKALTRRTRSRIDSHSQQFKAR
jgi:ABC-type phosphate transport system permease subunit